MKKIGILILFLTLMWGCEILHQSPLEVDSFSPSSSVINPIGSVQQIRLTFSEEAKRSTIEQAFSFRGNADEVMGRFSWPSSTQMVFTPLEPLKEGVKYEIGLNTKAEDIYGNSLSQDFSHRFSNNSDEIRPYVTGVLPLDGAVTDNLWEPMEIQFSESINTDSFQASIKLSPSVKGSWTWNPGQDVFTFQPLEALRLQEEYSLQLEGTLMDVNGNNIGPTWISRFSTGSEQVPPSLLGIRTPDNSINYANPGNNNIYPDWEKDSTIVLVFSEEVDKSSFELGFSMDPPWNYKVNINPMTPEEVVLTSTDFLGWDTLYTIGLERSIKDELGNPLDQSYHFFLRSNGAGSAPPRIISARLLDDLRNQMGAHPLYGPGSDPFQNISLDDYGTQKIGYLEIVMEIAQGAEIGYLDFLESIAIVPESNDFKFEKYHMEVVIDGANPRIQTVTVHMNMQANTGNGYVDVKLYSSFKDSLDNSLVETWNTQFWASKSPPVVP